MERTDPDRPSGRAKRNESAAGILVCLTASPGEGEQVRNRSSRDSRRRSAGARISVTAAVIGLLTVLGMTTAFATIAQKPDTPAVSGTAAWGANGRVWAIVRIGDVVYLGGNFTEAVRSDGMTRPRNDLMAVNAVTGALLSWQPSVSGIVFSLAVDGTTLLVGGDFTSVNGVARSNFAAIDSSGNVEDWHLDAANQIRALTFSNGTLYLGG